ITLIGKELNTSLHDGPMSLTRDQKFAFYNRNNFRTSKGGRNKGGVYKLNMFSAQNAGGKWYGVRPFQYNSLEYSTAHPALTPDGNVLYFVSDMPGGFGGKDLYYTVKTGDLWGKPVNMGSVINTEGDETFPYVSPDGTLYFSSNGHTGLGGLDIFKVTLKDKVPVSKITNLGVPVNSSKDDFGLIINASNASGYFSSNRYGSDDIFKYDYAPVVVKLEGKILTNYQNSKIAVPNAMVYLLYNSKVDSIYTDNIGRYKFSLAVNTPYTVSATKPGFIGPAKGDVTTVGIKKSTTLIKDLELLQKPLAPPIPPSPLTDCATAGRILNIENIFYDLDKFNIRKDALPAMNHLLSVL
ncbi:MAG: flagellar motor protein MotB, partial [Chitinophagaceae bacterium]